MKFIVRYDIPQNARKAAIARFLETGGLPPEGVEMVARWHTADGAFGFAIAETDDVQALTRWSLAWNDLLPMDIRPAADDASMGEVLASL
jgi:hypothetical protein